MVGRITHLEPMSIGCDLLEGVPHSETVGGFRKVHATLVILVLDAFIDLISGVRVKTDATST